MLLTSGVTATAVTLGVAAPAQAVAPTQLRSGCEWRTSADQERNIQTCHFFSESLGREVAVEVRASNQEDGATEQGVYFLDGLGATNDYNTWANPDVGEIDAYSKALNLVLPAGGAGEWMTNWQSNPVQNGQEIPAPQWDTFLGSELPAFLNANFSVQQRNNAVVGVSMSAGPAITLALNHPDVFSVVRAFSGFYQTNNPLGWQVIPSIQDSRTGISNGGVAMWGDPSKPGNVWAANDVSQRLKEIKANGQTVIISVGAGIPPLKTVVALIAQGGLLALPLVGVAIATGTVIEMASLVSTMVLNAQAVATGVPVRFKYTLGSHDFYSWAGSASSDAADIEKALAAAEATSKSSAAKLNASVVKQVSVDKASDQADSSPLSQPVSSASAATTSPVFPPTSTTSVTVPASSVTTPITPTPSSTESSSTESSSTESSSTESPSVEPSSTSTVPPSSGTDQTVTSPTSVTPSTTETPSTPSASTSTKPAAATATTASVG